MSVADDDVISLLQDIQTVSDFNHLTNTVCGGLLGNVNDPSSRILSQQPLDKKISHIRKQILWGQTFLKACQLNKGSEFLRASLSLPSEIFSSVDDKRKCTLDLYRSAIHMIQNEDVSNASNLMTVLIQSTEDLMVDDIPHIVEAVSSPFVTPASIEGEVVGGILAALELLPPLLNRVAKESGELKVVGRLRTDVSNLSGNSYAEHVIAEICSLQWLAGSHVKLVECFKDMALPPKLLALAVTKSVKQLEHVGLDELPALTYQLLLLGSQQGGAQREAVMLAIMRRFCLLDDPQEDETRHVLSAPISTDTDHMRSIVGNVIQLFNFAATQDQGLGSMVLKIVKGDDKTDEAFAWLKLTPFAATLALSIMQMQRFQQKVVETFLKLTADGACHHHRLLCSAWLSTCATTLVNKTGRGSHIGHVAWVLMRVVASNSGWDRITPALVQLGVALIDKVGPVAESFIATVELPASEPELGIALLRQIYITNRAARDTILTKILERLVARGKGVQYVLSLLEELTVRCPLDLLQQMNGLREMFSYLGEIRPRQGEELLRIVSPLFALQPGASEMAMLPLRKCLFSRNETVRLMAASGLIRLLSVVGGSDGSCQDLGHSSGGCMSITELLSLLRRCLTQQCSVRRAVYFGLTQCFISHAVLRRPIYSFISAHLRRFIRTEGDRFDLDRCIAVSPSPHIVEPLGHLICCASHMLTITDSVDDSSLKEELFSITTQLETLDLTDYLDNSECFAMESDDGMDKCRVILLKGVLEACIVHVAHCDVGRLGQPTAQLSDKAVVCVISLFKHYDVLPTLLEACVADKKTTKSKKDAAAEVDSNEVVESARTTCFSLNAAVPLLRTFTDDGLVQSVVEARMFGIMRRFFLQVASEELEYLQIDSSQSEQLQFSSTSHFPRFHPQVTARAHKVRDQAMALGPLFFKAYKATRENPAEVPTASPDDDRTAPSSSLSSSVVKKAKPKAAASGTSAELGLSGFQTCLQLMLAAATVISSENIGGYMSNENEQEGGYTIQHIVSVFVWDCFAATPKDASTGQDPVAIIGKGVKSLIKHVAAFCESTSHLALNQHLAFIALECILTLTAAIPSSQTGVIAKKVGELCRAQRAPTIQLCEELTKVFVACHGGSCSTSLSHINELSEAVLDQLGHSFGDTPTQDPSGCFRLVEDSEISRANKRSMASVVAEVLSEGFDHSVMDVEYLLVGLKRLPKIDRRKRLIVEEDVNSIPEPTEVMSICDKVCDRVVELLKALLPLLKCRLDPGKYLERLFGVVRRLYDCIGKLVKFFVDHKVLWLSKASKVVLGFSAEQFTPVVYHFIQHTMDSGQADRLQLASQGKLVPAIVERIEFVDLQLVTLGRICVKTEDVHAFIVRASARDFKIDVAALQSAHQMADEKAKRKKDQKATKSKKKKTESKEEEQETMENEDTEDETEMGE